MTFHHKRGVIIWCAKCASASRQSPPLSFHLQCAPQNGHIIVGNVLCFSFG